jgi:hypothetical protein
MTVCQEFKAVLSAIERRLSIDNGLLNYERHQNSSQYEDFAFVRDSDAHNDLRKICVALRRLRIIHNSFSMGFSGQLAKQCLYNQLFVMRTMSARLDSYGRRWKAIPLPVIANSSLQMRDSPFTPQKVQSSRMLPVLRSRSLSAEKDLFESKMFSSGTICSPRQ